MTDEVPLSAEELSKPSKREVGQLDIQEIEPVDHTLGSTSARSSQLINRGFKCGRKGCCGY